MPVDEKVRCGLMLAGGIISSKLEAFCIKHLLPLPENRERNLHREESNKLCYTDSALKLLYVTRLNWRTSHYENTHYTFETDLCRADRFHAVHPVSRRNQEQTACSRP